MAIRRWYPLRDLAFWGAGVVKSAAAATVAAVVGSKDSPETNYFFWGGLAVLATTQIAEVVAARFWTVKESRHGCKNRYNVAMLMTILESGTAALAGHFATSSDHCAHDQSICLTDPKALAALGGVAALLLAHGVGAYCLRPTIASPALLSAP